MSLTSGAETYLKAIYQLSSQGAAVTTGALAQRLAVASPSVSAMVKRLEGEAYVERTDSGQVALTRSGTEAAVRVVRRHRLVETFLHRVVGLAWHEVHAEAERLEHAISDGLERRIEELLDFPSHDPHGDPIPPRQLDAHREAWPDPLLGAPTGGSFRIERVSDRDPAALEYLADLGLGPGVVVGVVRVDPFEGPLWLRLNGPAAAQARDVAVSRTLAGQVFGSVEDRA